MPPKAKMFKRDSAFTTLLSPGNINFAKNLYSVLCQKEEGNIVFSPFSIEIVLILIYMGALENTEKEIREALQLPSNKNDTLKAVKSVLDDLEDKDAVILIANALFLNKNFEIKKDFENNSKKYFSALVKNFDFMQKKKTIEEINKFVENKTNKKILNALNEDAIKVDTRAFVVNTVYFNGFWEDQFNPDKTEKDNFYINRTEVVRVDFMRRTDYFMYNKNPGYHIVKLPYEGSHYRNCYMILIIPDKINGLETIEKKVKNLNLIDIINACPSDKKIRLILPKFELNETMPDLKNVLQELQIKDLFVPFKANLKGMSDESGLFIDDVVHKCFLKVTEKGTEAAAYTYGAPATGGAGLPPPKLIEVKADRPFLFFIYDSSTEMILFFGRVKIFQGCTFDSDSDSTDS